MTFDETFLAFKRMIAESGITKKELVKKSGISGKRLDEILISHDAQLREFAGIAFALGVDIKFSVKPDDEKERACT